MVLRDSSRLESDWSTSVPISKDPWRRDTGLQRADGQSALGMTPLIGADRVWMFTSLVLRICV